LDLAVASYLLLLAAAIIYRLGRRFGARFPLLAQVLLVIGIVTAVYLAWGTGSNFRWALFIPHGAVFLLANASVILIVGAAGLIVGSHCLVTAQGSLSKERAAAVGLCLTAACFISSAVLRPLWQPLTLSGDNRWIDDVCMQTHESTCAPAAVATLLRRHGVDRSEAEMASACLTSSSGTLALGTYRGLCIGSIGHDLVPHAIVCDTQTVSSLELCEHLPLLVHVGFASEAWPVRTSKQREGHVVVVLEKMPNDRWLIADPAVGKTIWSDTRLRSAWVGEAIYMTHKVRSELIVAN
jgi:hypothetical protein